MDEFAHRRQETREHLADLVAHSAWLRAASRQAVERGNALERESAAAMARLKRLCAGADPEANAHYSPPTH